MRSGKENIKHESLKRNMRLVYSKTSKKDSVGQRGSWCMDPFKIPTIKAEAKLNRGSRLTNAPLPKMATPSFPEPINMLPYMAQGTLQM